MSVEGTDLRDLIARYGVSPDAGLVVLYRFGARLSDALRDRLRHEPDVVYVEDDCYEYPAAGGLTRA